MVTPEAFRDPLSVSAVADAGVLALHAEALAARRREEYSDEQIVCALIAMTGGDPQLLEAAWRRCARRDAAPETRAGAALLHRAWARVHGYRETIFVPRRPGVATPVEVDGAAGAPVVIAAEPAVGIQQAVEKAGGRLRTWWRRLRRR